MDSRKYFLFTGRRGAVNVDSGGDELPSKPETDTANVSDLLKDQLKQDRLTLLSGGSLIGALTEFVDKNENDAISWCVCACVCVCV